jgi:hypothetical protein
VRNKNENITCILLIESQEMLGSKNAKKTTCISDRKNTLEIRTGILEIKTRILEIKREINGRSTGDQMEIKIKIVHISSKIQAKHVEIKREIKREINGRSTGDQREINGRSTGDQREIKWRSKRESWRSKVGKGSVYMQPKIPTVLGDRQRRMYIPILLGLLENISRRAWPTNAVQAPSQQGVDSLLYMELIRHFCTS